MAYNFPNSPTEGTEYVPPVGGQTYIYQSSRWVVKGTPPVVSGTVIGTEWLTLSPSTNNEDNYASTAALEKNIHTILNLSPTKCIVVTGIATTSWEVGKRITIRNATSRTGANARAIILPRNASSSSAANRFQYPGSKRLPLILMPEESADFAYDGTDLKVIRTFRPLTMQGYFDYLIDGTWMGAAYVSGTGAASTTMATGTDANSEPYLHLTASTGTTTTGRSHILDSSASVRGGAGAMLSLARVNVPALSTVSEEFELHIGFTEAMAITVNDEMCWLYRRLTGTSWLGRTASNASVNNTTITGFVVSITDTPILGVFVNGDATRVEFFYSNDGGITWTVFGTANTTVIPATTSRTFGFGGSIFKTAGTTSATFRLLFCGIIGWT